jgi:hypothetical protein
MEENLNVFSKFFCPVLLFGKSYLHGGNHSGLSFALAWRHLDCPNCDLAHFEVFNEPVPRDFSYVNGGRYGLASCFKVISLRFPAERLVMIART